MKRSAFFLLVLVAAAAIPHETSLGDTFETDYGLLPAAIVIGDADMGTFNSVRRIVERSDARGLLFYRLLENAVQIDPVPYKRLVERDSRPNHNM